MNGNTAHGSRVECAKKKVRSGAKEEEAREGEATPNGNHMAEGVEQLIKNAREKGS